MGQAYLPIISGGLERDQCRHVFQSHGAYGICIQMSHFHWFIAELEAKPLTLPIRDHVQDTVVPPLEKRWPT